MTHGPDELLTAGLEHHQAGRLNAASACYGQVLAIQPNHPDALHLLSTIAFHQRNYDAALQLVQSALRIRADIASFHQTHGKIQHALGAYEEAEKAFRNGLRFAPPTAGILSDLGQSLHEQGRWPMAAAAYKQAINLQPQALQTWSRYARLLAYEADTTRADFQRLEPAFARAAYLQCIAALVYTANAHEYDAVIEEALSQFPADYELEAARLYGRNFDPAVTATALADQYRQWSEKHSARWPTPTELPSLELHDGRMHIAYVGTYLHYGFMRNFIPHHDEKRFKIFVFTNEKRSSLKELNLAIEVIGFGNDDLARLCREHRIHIAIDLCSTLPTRGSMEQFVQFHKRIAPIQCSWIATINTTGSSSFDAIIADREIVNPPNHHLYSERIALMPEVCHCWLPDPQAPEPGPSPAKRNGYITFGSANRGFKMSDKQLGLWAKIVSRCPDSHFHFKGSHCIERGFLKRASQQFATRGISRDRISFSPASPHPIFFDFHREIDISLDTFPYNGGITSLESLWMGVPVVTRSGRRFVSRVTRSYLACLGYESWIAETDDDFIEKACDLASDVEHLESCRNTLREKLSASKLFDGPTFTRELEEEYSHIYSQALA